MPDLVVVVPSRGRPDAARELARTFAGTCTAQTRLLFAVDMDDPAHGDYIIGDYIAAVDLDVPSARAAYVLGQDTTTMVDALNQAAAVAVETGAFAVGFMGDDHRPRTVGWDRAYLDALHGLGTGIVYGNDLLQRERLATQCAMTSDIVRALGWMAPPPLTHLYVDNFWMSLGAALGRLRYLPDVVVEHCHPFAGTGQWDAGYQRVNAPALYERDRVAFEAYMAAGFDADVAKVRRVAPALAG